MSNNMNHPFPRYLIWYAGHHPDDVGFITNYVEAEGQMIGQPETTLVMDNATTWVHSDDGMAKAMEVRAKLNESGHATIVVPLE